MKKRKIKLDNHPRGSAVEILGEGQQFVAAGSHSSGVRYQWTPGLPESLPTLTLDQVNQIWSVLTRTYATPDSAKANSIAPAGAGTTTPSVKETSLPLEASQETLTSCSEEDWSQLISALRALFDEGGSNDTWSEIGYALLSLQATRPARQLWIEWSRKAKGWTEGAPEKWWDDHHTQQTRTDYRHIFTLARAQGWGRSSDPSVFGPVREGVARSEVGAGEASDVHSDSDASAVDVAPPPLPTKPVVRLVAGQLSSIVHQLEEIIEPYIFTQGPQLVRPTEAHNDREIRRSTDAIMLCEATKSWAKVRLGELAEFKRFSNGGNWVNVDPSAEHINALLELGSWNVLRPLEAIARAPFMRADGSICDNPGYDRRSRVLYLPGALYPAIPAVPNHDHARAALGRIRGVFHQFPWKEAASESAFLSHILTEAARLAIDCSPMFFYTAPSAGTGKSILSKMASTIVHGTIPALRAWVSDGDELRKVLFAALLAGDRSLLFDNVPAGFKTRAAELCGFITAETYNGRKLGESESHSVPNRAVLSATGNNITPVGDMARRSIVVRLDANTERLSQRRFEIENLPQYVLAHRPELLVNALTIIKAYHATGGISDMPTPLPSFESWSKTVREPLLWLGMVDPCDTSNETDDETKSLGDVFAALAGHFGDREFTANDVARVVGGLLDTNGELITVMQQSGCSEPTSALKVGYWLRGERDKISDGWKLVTSGSVRHTNRWKFIKVEETLT